MKLIFKEYWPIFEMLNTKFDNSLNWNIEAGKDIAIGTLDDLKIKISIDPISYEKLVGLNLVFGIWDGEDFKELAGSIKTQISAKIIGAVTNAFKERIDHYEWDFLTLIAKDNVETRMKLYTRMADRLSREGLHHQINERKDGNGVIVIGKKGINIRDVWNNLK